MILVGIYIAFVVGIVVGAILNPEETCPAAVKGYNCKGDTCDHRKSTLYQAKLDMALGAEEDERKREREQNLWGGDKDA